MGVRYRKYGLSLIVKWPIGGYCGNYCLADDALFSHVDRSDAQAVAGGFCHLGSAIVVVDVIVL